MRILYPTLLKQPNDLQRDPLRLQAARQVYSSAFQVDGDITLSDAETAYHTYGQMMPQTSSTSAPEHVPTNFTVVVDQGQSGARVSIYNAQVGDPFFESRVFMGAAATSTTVIFDGKFNTTAAKTASVTLGSRYFWGSWQIGPHPQGQVQWQQQSMVFPITWR
jgi:hypothetical protein